MTPLANHFLKDACKPIHKRIFKDTGQRFISLLSDCHYFEASEAVPLLPVFVESLYKSGNSAAMERLVFLPAPKTWIEWWSPSDGRLCFLLVDKGNGRAEISFGCENYLIPLGFVSTVSDDVWTNERDYPRELVDPNVRVAIMTSAHIFLALINSPRILGRRQHMPARAIERRLAAGLGIQGRFPLRTWTELKLEITPPEEAVGYYEGRLTGKKALHFCRAHLRIRRGQLEYVRSHWRGDASLGIKQTRYALSEKGNGLAAVESITTGENLRRAGIGGA